MEATLRRSIRRLDPETASRIAAGEVIERPLSALKEVLENALDAGARAIEVRVEGSLDRRFTVADDGAGIAEDELELALERHATSKIAALSDLDRLGTLGFRGEALPSIAAVSRIRITSRPRGAESASFIAAEAGGVRERGNAARAFGTTVEVANLFFNMATGKMGLVGIWDAIGFDEVADLQKMPKEVITTLKTYCESGTFARGKCLHGYMLIKRCGT